MASLCNYTQPELQITDGLVRQQSGSLFPYNPEFYERATGLYGPGAIYCWYMLLASVLANWFYRHANDKKPNLSSDLVGAVAYPLFAATDLFIQLIRIKGVKEWAWAIQCLRFPHYENLRPDNLDSTPLDLKAIPPEVLDLGQRAVDIIGPLMISWTAVLFLCFLAILFARPHAGTTLRKMPSPYLVMFAAIGYISLILTIFYFSLNNMEIAYNLFVCEAFAQVVIMGTCIVTVLVTLAMPPATGLLIRAWIKGNGDDAKEHWAIVKSAPLLVLLLLAPLFIIIFYLSMSIVPDLAIQVTERDQLATLIVGIVTLIYTILEICHNRFWQRDVVVEETEMLPLGGGRDSSDEVA